jgi:hypothetical protein
MGVIIGEPDLAARLESLDTVDDDAADTPVELEPDSLDESTRGLCVPAIARICQAFGVDTPELPRSVRHSAVARV